jgi:hypothetical protein
MQKKMDNTHLINVFVFCGLIAFVLALGTNLHWLGRAVENVPHFISRIISNSDAEIPLPGYFLYKYFPFYSFMRVWMRYGIFVSLFAIALAGIGAAWLISRVGPRWKTLLSLGLLVLIIFDFYPGIFTQFSLVADRPIDTWLAKQPGNGAVVQFPIELVEDQDQIYPTLTYNKPFIGGFFNAFPPEQYQRIKPVMMNFPDQESIDLLKNLGVEFVLVDSSNYPEFNQVRDSIEKLGLEMLTVIGSEYVYRLPVK